MTMSMSMPGRSRIGPHMFAVGQGVELLRSAFDPSTLRGGYVSTRALPGDDFDRTYRARSSADGVETVFCETQLSATKGFLRA